MRSVFEEKENIFNSILLYSILFRSILFYSILFYYILFYSIHSLSSSSDLECYGGGGWLGLVCAETDPLLLQPLLVVQVVLHVVQHHVTSRDVHGGNPGLFLPVQ